MSRLTILRPLILLSATFVVSALTGCASVVGADFDGAIAAPTQCDLLQPQSADPRRYKPCETGSTCATTDDETRTVCAPLRAEGGPGDRCEAINDCAPGLTCSTIGCVVMCAVGSTCDDGSSCVGFSPELVLGERSFGYCQAPSCDPWLPQDPAEGLERCATEQCRFVADNRTACFNARGSTKSTGETCSDDLDCSASDTCYEHTCARLCRTAEDNCLRNDVCVEGASDVGTPVLLGQTFGHCERRAR